MVQTLALATATVFFVLAGMHVYMAVAKHGRWRRLALPHVNGRPAFTPSTTGTVMVAVALSGCALLVLGQIGWFDELAPRWIFRLGTAALAGALVLRAIGDFRLVGFFKRPNLSIFARLDTWLYSPLCTLLGACCALIAFYAT